MHLQFHCCTPLASTQIRFLRQAKVTKRLTKVNVKAFLDSVDRKLGDVTKIAYEVIYASDNQRNRVEVKPSSNQCEVRRNGGAAGCLREDFVKHGLLYCALC